MQARYEAACKWMVYGVDGLGGEGCMRMRPKLHLPVIGRAFRVTSVTCGIVRHLEDAVSHRSMGLEGS